MALPDCKSCHVTAFRVFHLSFAIVSTIPRLSRLPPTLSSPFPPFPPPPRKKKGSWEKILIRAAVSQYRVHPSPFFATAALLAVVEISRYR